MTIGQLAARTGLSVRTLRFYADAGVLPEATRSHAGYRMFTPDAVPRGRLVRTLRELGVGLDDVRRVLSAEASLADVAAAHAQALDIQIRTLRLQRAVLRDPDYIAASRRMAERARAEGPEPDPAQFEAGKAIGEHAGAALHLDPASPGALAVVERIEAMRPGGPEDRATVAERIEAFSDRRVARYWTLVGVVNGWPQTQTPGPQDMLDAWEWYARALRAHAGEVSRPRQESISSCLYKQRLI